MNQKFQAEDQMNEKFQAEDQMNEKFQAFNNFSCPSLNKAKVG